MPVKGEIHVRVTAGDASICARWLRGVYLPALATRADTILTPGFNNETCDLLDGLAAILQRSAVRKRASGLSFAINLPRLMVERAGRINHGASVRWPAPVGVVRVIAAMEDALQSRQGRPRLSLAQRRERLSPEFIMIQDRQKKRLKRQNRVDDAWTRWLDETGKRGETILTSSAPGPKI